MTPQTPETTSCIIFVLCKPLCPQYMSTKNNQIINILNKENVTRTLKDVFIGEHDIETIYSYLYWGVDREDSA